MKHVLTASVGNKKLYWTGGKVSTDPDLAQVFTSSTGAKAALKRIQSLHLADTMEENGKDEQLNFEVTKK